MKRIEDEAYCVMCGKLYSRLKKGGTNHKRGCGVRPSNVKTCSPQCSKILRDTKRQRKKMTKEELKEKFINSVCVVN